MMRTTLLFLSSLVLFSCFEEPESLDRQVIGMKPIYIQQDQLQEISSEPSKAFSELGKIVYRDETIYINERYQGIHVVDNSDPLNPTNIHFWRIPGNVDFIIKGDYLYADNGADLLTIDISSPANIVLSSKVENFYPSIRLEKFPRDYRGFFECVDTTQGFVLDWEEVLLNNPKCSI